MSQTEACLWYWISIGLIALCAMIYKIIIQLILGPPGYY